LRRDSAEYVPVLTFRQDGAFGAETTLVVLPDGFHAVMTKVGALVVGPTGAYLVVDGDDVGSETEAGSLAAAAATDLRRALAERTTWVPFIEPLVVSSHVSPRGPASVVPRDLFVTIISEGHETVDDATVRRLIDLTAALDT
jgi:hypothetical protein